MAYKKRVLSIQSHVVSGCKCFKWDSPQPKCVRMRSDPLDQHGESKVQKERKQSNMFGKINLGVH